MNAFPETRQDTPVPIAHGHPCALDCSYARPLRNDPLAEEWLWCAHPANAQHIVHPGHPCPRYAPPDQRTTILGLTPATRADATGS